MPTKILVVDDSATMRRVLEMTFAGEDAQVVTVDNGEAAVAKAAETSPDVVFADASMSGVDGYEVARRIKANGGKTAVILMASQHHPYDDGKGRSAGVDDHISKPFDTQSVIDRVSQVLAKPRAAAGAAPAAAAPMPAAAPKPAAPAPVAPAAPGPGRTPLAGRTVMGVQPPIQPAPAPVARPAAPAPQAPPPRPAPAATAPFAPMSAPPAKPAPAPAPAAPAPAARPAAGAAAVAAATGGMAAKLSGLGLSKDQVESILSLTREVVEQVVWEVVPDLAEQIIKEEIKRLTAD